MPGLDDHFDALTRIRPPGTWPELADGEPGTPGPRLRPRRLWVAALAFAVAAAGLGFAVRAFLTERAAAPSRHPTTAVSPPAGETARPSPTRATPSATPAPAPQSGMFAAMLDAIRAASPQGWRFPLTGDRLDGDWSLDGNADDGSGPGRLLVYVTVRPGMLEADPCADSEFRQGGRCVRRSLPNGDLLVLRDVVVDPGGMKTIEAVLVHPDRSGVGAEAGNWTVPPLPGSTPISRSDLPTPGVTRADPLYTVEELGRLVRAVDASTRECIRTSC